MYAINSVVIIITYHPRGGSTGGWGPPTAPLWKMWSPSAPPSFWPTFLKWSVLQFVACWIVFIDCQDGLLKVQHSGRKWPTGVETSTVVELEPHVTSSSQDSSTSNQNELLALLPEHSELQSAAPAESTSWWRCVCLLRQTSYMNCYCYCCCCYYYY